MRVLSIVMAVVITAFVGIGSAFAGPQGSGHEGAGKNGSHGERGFLKMIEKLALNADQEKEIASILGKHRDEIGKTIAGIVEARQGLREAITADVYSEDAVRQAAQRVSEQEVQAAVLRAQIANEVVQQELVFAQERSHRRVSRRHVQEQAEGLVDGGGRGGGDHVAGQ